MSDIWCAVLFFCCCFSQADAFSRLTVIRSLMKDFFLNTDSHDMACHLLFPPPRSCSSDLRSHHNLGGLQHCFFLCFQHTLQTRLISLDRGGIFCLSHWSDIDTCALSPKTPTKDVLFNIVNLLFAAAENFWSRFQKIKFVLCLHMKTNKFLVFLYLFTVKLSVPWYRKHLNMYHQSRFHECPIYSQKWQLTSVMSDACIGPCSALY